MNLYIDYSEFELTCWNREQGWRFPAGKYYPTLDGRQARAAREAGAFDYGGCGAKPRLISKCL